MLMQYDDDYERRRAYIARRRRQRKRQRTVRILILLLILGLLAAFGIGGWLWTRHKKNKLADPNRPDSQTVSEAPGNSESGPEEERTGPDGSDPSAEGGETEENSLEALLADAEALALGYDYDGAIATFNEIIAKNGEFVAEAYAKIGDCYFFQGQDIEEANSKLTMDDPKYAEGEAKVKDFYGKAQPFYEKAKELAPDNKQLWGQFLLRIYWKLNKAEYDALEKELGY